MRMRELAERSGLPPSTIHYYLSEGLVPEPEKPTRNSARYGPEHLERLNLIRSLRARGEGLPMSAVRRVLELVDQGVEPEVAVALQRSVLGAMPIAPQDAAAYDLDHSGRYDEGWDTLRENRLRKLKSMGLVPASMVDRPREAWIQAWNQLTDEQRQNRARDMEIYAAMIDYMDESIGRLFGYLKSIGEYDNTLIVFFSDNGASKTTIEDYAGIGGEMDEFLKGCDNGFNNRGFAGSYTSTVFVGTSGGDVEIHPPAKKIRPPPATAVSSERASERESVNQVLVEASKMSTRSL